MLLVTACSPSPHKKVALLLTCDRWKMNFVQLYCKISANAFCNAGSNFCLIGWLVFQNSYWICLQEASAGPFQSCPSPPFKSLVSAGDTFLSSDTQTLIHIK